MMWAGWIRFRASLMAMRRTSWIDQRIKDGVAVVWFLPWFGGWFFLAAADWRDGGSPPSLYGSDKCPHNLALQLPFCFEMRALSDRLVSSAPE